MDRLALIDTLKRFGRRLLLIAGVAGFGWSLAVSLLWIIAAAWFDLLVELPSGTRLILLMSAVVLALATFTILQWRTYQRCRPGSLAHRVDEILEDSGEVAAGAALIEDANAANYSMHPQLTSGLAELAIERASRLANSVSATSVAPVRPIGRSFGLVGLIALTMLAIVLIAPRMAQTQWLRFADPYGDTPPYSQVQFQVEPEGARVVYGSGLDVRVTTIGPTVDVLELVLNSTASAGASAEEQVLTMFPEQSGQWRASLSNLTEPLAFYIRTGRARSRRYDIEIITVPRIEAVRFRVTPPEYTRDADYRGPLPPDGLEGLPGTKVQLWASSNRPLNGGLMQVHTDGAVQDVPTSAGSSQTEITAEFLIQKPGRLDLKLRDVDGQESAETFTAPINVLADEHPFVRILEPRAIAFATPSVSVPAVIAAEDDYGVERVELFRSLNDSQYLPMEIPVPSPPIRRTQESVSLPLSAYGVQPGDEIKLFARVQDNDPSGDGVGKGAESSLAVIRIISEEEFQRMIRARDGFALLTSKYQQAQRRLERLANEVESLKKDLESTTDPAQKQDLEQKLQALGQRMQEEADAIKKLGESELPYELDSELREKLKELAKSLESMSQETKALANEKPTGERARTHVEELQKKLNTLRQQHNDESMEALRGLEHTLPLMKDASRFTELYLRQRDLADRSASLKGRDGEDDPQLRARMRELEAQQQQIRRDLETLLNDIEEHANQLPDDEQLEKLRRTALDFAAECRASGADGKMVEAETSLLEFDGTHAHDAATEAADILESMLKKCDGVGKQCKDCLPGFQPSLGSCLQSTLEQLLADAGLKFGTGSGSGIGMGSGGYSAQRSTMQNVGLYGNIPYMDATSAGGDRRGDNALAGPGSGGRAAPQQDNRATSMSLRTKGQASGAGDTRVPAQYRSQVGRYFERLAEELGDAP